MTKEKEKKFRSKTKKNEINDFFLPLFEYNTQILR